jgi:hypothetical protein
MNIVIKIVSVPTTEYDHLRATNKVSRVVETGHWGTTALRTLIPGHCDGVKCVQVSEYRLLAFSAENDYSSTSEDSSMTVT